MNEGADQTQATAIAEVIKEVSANIPQAIALRHHQIAQSLKNALGDLKEECNEVQLEGERITFWVDNPSAAHLMKLRLTGIQSQLQELMPNSLKVRVMIGRRR